LKKVNLNGKKCSDSRIIADHAKIEIQFNGENIQIFGEGNEVSVSTNSGNIQIYGDNNSVNIQGNQSNLHIFGDYLQVLVENNDCNLHIYGDHSNVVVQKGRAIAYGCYGDVTIHGNAEVDVYGKYKKTNKIK
jgi:hypothetical protein